MQRHLALALIAAAAAGAAWSWWSSKDPAAVQAQVQHCALAPTSAEHPGMVWVPGGAFTLGTDVGFPEEGPAVPAQLSGFWMDQTEVTNAQFAQFVKATGYRTLAETPAVAGSAVFRPRGDGEAMRSFVNWWQFVRGADWRHPGGPDTSIEGLEMHPVVHVAHEDALAYARWKGRSLPTEEQFEFAAQHGVRRNGAGAYVANTWQGSFPRMNSAADGFAGTSPVGCYPPNEQGLHDLIGNVWEWTASPYYERHDLAARDRHPHGFDPAQPGEPVAALKGGSYLCSPDYCMRYRPEARIGQSRGLGTAHIGFRTVANATTPAPVVDRMR